MPISMYEASVPVFTRFLNNTSALLDKAAAHCAAKKIDPTVIANFRLAPDMLPLKNQIFILTDQAKGCVARLAGAEVPSYPDTENTLDELKARLAKTAAFAQGFKPGQIDGSEARDIVLKLGPPGNQVEFKFKGLDYLQGFTIPNFYFHVTMTYAILRHCGVDIGKRDFLGPPPG
jgi:hypothetical protein